jgi:prophage regulatory protein
MQALLRLPVVKARTGLSRSTIYARIREGTFPAPVNLGKRAVAWNCESIDAWIAVQIKRSRSNAA